MNCYDFSNDIKEYKKKSSSNCDLENIKSKYIITKIFDNLQKKKFLKIIKYNKQIKNRLNLSDNDYKEFSKLFSSIEIELIPIENKYYKFINILHEEEERYYHIYFNDSKEEIKRHYLIKNDKVTKIKILINYQVKSFSELFSGCQFVSSINFKTFYRNNINNMNHMFYYCSSLKEINLSNFNTCKVTNMRYMFHECSSLKEINLSNFNTDNVINMKSMFYGCSSLINVNLSNFNINKVMDMSYMFFKCPLLKEINIPNFNINNETDVCYMHSECSEILKKKVKEQFQNIKNEAFY